MIDSTIAWSTVWPFSEHAFHDPTRWQAFAALLAAAATAGLLTAAIVQLRGLRRQVVRQLFPLVLAHQWKGPTTKHEDGPEGHLQYRYFLQNVGNGPAINVRHGVEVGGHRYRFGGTAAGFRFTTVEPRETLPPLDPDRRDPVPEDFLEVYVPPDSGTGAVYWCRYQNIDGERFETRNPADPEADAEVLGPLAISGAD